MPADDHSSLMDRIYRYERRIYDPLRKLFLLGRDRLLDRLDAGPGDRILEVGCGTARNLIALHRRASEARLYGLDASEQMLATAGAKLRRRRLERKVSLRHGLAEELDPEAAFGLGVPFDAVFFSYSLSMIHDWRRALDVAWSHVAPGGRLLVVDFCDQAGLPRWFRSLLQARLASYHVRFRPEMLKHLHELGRQGTAEIEQVWRRYAFFATLRRSLD